MEVKQAKRSPTTVELPPAEDLVGEGVTEDAERDVATSVFSYFSSAAKTDKDLTQEEREALTITTEDTPDSGGESLAAVYARECRENGDRLTALRNSKSSKKFQKEATDSPDPKNVVQKLIDLFGSLFEVDPDTGRATFNSGRLVVMFFVAFDTCVAFVRRHGLDLVMSFMQNFVSRLLRFLSSTGFFSWLLQSGGFMCLIQATRWDRYFQGLLHGAVIVAAIGLGVHYVLPGLKKLLWR